MDVGLLACRPVWRWYYTRSDGICVSIPTNAAVITDEIVEQLDNVDMSGLKSSVESACEKFMALFV